MNPHFVTRRVCPACGGGNAATVFSRPYAQPVLRAALEKFYAEVGGLDYPALLGADYVVQACADCGLHFQRDVPDDFLLAKLYEEWISPTQAYARFHAHIAAARQSEIRREVYLTLSLVRAVPETVGPAGGRAASPVDDGPGRPPRPLRALDYGCGWGEWAQMTKTLGVETWGTELSPSRRAACERAGIKIATDDALPTAAFDLINADQVFEHLPAPATTLTLLKTKLAPGGVIRLAVPNGWRIAENFHRFDREIAKPRLGGLNPIAPLEHLNGFTTRSLVRLAARCGLTRVAPSWRAFSRGWVLGPGLRSAAKQLVLPLYLRSNWSTQLWFASAA